MRAKGVDGLSIREIQNEVERGGKFVVYTYCISFIFQSCKRSSQVYFIKSGENAFTKGWPFNLISFLFGWWGIPWGIVYTCGCLWSNIGGGRNVTTEVMQAMQQPTKGYVFEFEQV